MITFGYAEGDHLYSFGVFPAFIEPIRQIRLYRENGMIAWLQIGQMVGGEDAKTAALYNALLKNLDKCGSQPV